MATKKPTAAYVAMVVVTCYVDGVRTDVQPGEPLPELPEHDVVQLLRMKAIADPADAAKADKKAAADAAAANAEFQDARKAVAAADASTQAAA